MSKNSKLSDKKYRQDHFHQKAKKQGFAARAVFKLEEIDRKYSLIGSGSRILDLGCAPGSWLQYAGQKAGPKARLVGIDRFAVNVPHPGMRTMVGDIYETPLADLVGDLKGFDVVLSDMAPDTTGIRHVDQTRSEALFERAVEIALETLVPGGSFVGKLFQGPDFSRLIKMCREAFTKVHIVKPESSRQESIEQYIVALGRRKKSEPATNKDSDKGSR